MSRQIAGAGQEILVWACTRTNMICFTSARVAGAARQTSNAENTSVGIRRAIATPLSSNRVPDPAVDPARTGAKRPPAYTVLCSMRYEAGVNQAIDFVANPGIALLRLLVAGLLG